MPIAEISIVEGRSKEMKKNLIANVTDAICESLGAPKQAVRVLIREVPKENWGIGGELFEDVRK
ncbi:2-hydroxymuconate tautomerase [Colwellia sp. UCD-KL20]|uniref:2-hydroxymuconate tautomerase n=1 Tax=Colwellia sp. UCD-KL20 TaxID=1917165 RepID=UPI000970F943|nr:2-hydroxymuconate tautomerase [Colwellia sp. UCD-KL20]